MTDEEKEELLNKLHTPELDAYFTELVRRHEEKKKQENVKNDRYIDY